MSYAFPGELQQLVQSELAKGVYASEDELLLVALKAFREREQVFQQFRAEVQSRIESLERGEGIELDDEQALREFADEIKAEGRRSWEADQKRP
jgi:Arc/MetJ-type ribon-helix-helix transcriptional regulator